MRRFFTTVSLLAALTTQASAELSTAERDLLRQSRNAPVLTSDGALVGETDGGSVTADRIRLFLDAVPGSVFSRLGKPIVLNTNATDITLINDAWVLSSDRLRVRTRANFVQTEDAPITINLPRR
ncbi:hypothetical protein [uncultured Tateyamaria sp.]|uniref:hypothetical protein n=1 Tax=Tateyamaria sp. 1078 TaxID=3417464 RepID=UPI0026291679|nr:hypothetical protein [uncultured Tateyamaria sp.]